MKKKLCYLVMFLCWVSGGWRLATMNSAQAVGVPAPIDPEEEFDEWWLDWYDPADWAPSYVAAPARDWSDLSLPTQEELLGTDLQFVSDVPAPKKARRKK